ncbi:MAG: iron ABC transporter substrate-binding protein [Dehalococcoidia bacterium]
MLRRFAAVGLVLIAASLAIPACSGDDEVRLIVYSGRSANLIGPMFDQFEEETGIIVEGRYGSTAEMAATLLEEGDNSPADLFIAQDPGGLGAVEVAGLFAPLPAGALEAVPAQWRSSEGGWVGLSGRARVLVYNVETFPNGEGLPASVFDLTRPEWSGRVGWAPPNGSFQAFVTAMRVHEGEDATRQWLEDMIANDVQSYANNVAIVEAVAAGEIEVGLVNHYYLHQFLAERGESYGARNYHFPDGDIGSLISVAGGGVLKTADHPEEAARLLEFLLSREAQEYFSSETFEYPVVPSVTPSGDVPALDELNPPDVDLNDLTDLEGTLELLREVGALE